MGRTVPSHAGLRALRRRSGFLLSELLAALMIISLLVPVSLFTVETAAGALDFNENVQDEIASAQLRRILSLSDEIHADSGAIYLNYLERDMRIVFANRHVYLTPGTQIFYSDVDQAWFGTEGETVYVWICRKKSVRRIAAAHIF